MAFGSATFGSSILGGARSYILIGQQYSMSAAAGAYGYTGKPVGLKLSAKGVVLAGSYAASGKPTSFTHQRKIIAQKGSYTITGRAQALTRGTMIGLSAGHYAFAPELVGLLYGTKLVAEAGTYHLATVSVTLKALERNGWEIPGAPIDQWTLLGTGGGDWLEVTPAANGWTQV